MKLSIVIPNYNGEHLLKKNLAKVVAASENAEVIIVDDASTDGSVGFLEKQFPQIKIIRQNKNQGFACACNTGFKNASGEIVMLLNNDVWPESDYLRYILHHFRDERVFAVGALEITQGKNRGKAIGKFTRGMFVHQEANNLDPGISLWAFAASSAFNREKWLRLGGMDELFKPAYWEDIDISWRAWKKGWKVIFEPKSLIHHEPESTNLNVFGRRKMRIMSVRNQFLFIWKNIHSPALIAEHLVWLPYHFVLALIQLDFSFLWGFGKALTGLPQVLQARKNSLSHNDIPEAEIFGLFKNTN